MRSRNKIFRLLALFMAIQMVTATIMPTMSYALTSGPSQPEFSSFEPVATTNMVNNFTGDFTYNLPILEVPGPQGSSYPISLSYHSGATPDEEASWVGYGWTLNAGAINRAVSGIPDDFKSKKIITHNIAPKNWTATVGAGTALEIFGKDKNKKTPTESSTPPGAVQRGLNASVSLRYNNYRGFGYNVGAGVSLGKGVLSIGYSASDGSGSFSLGINPMALLDGPQKLSINEREKFSRKGKKSLYKSAVRGLFDRQSEGINISRNTLGASFYGLLNYAGSTKTIQLQPYEGKAFNFSVGLELNGAPVPIGPSANIFGSYAFQKNITKVESDAYGYLYSGEANTDESKPEDNLMDYHTEKGSSFNKKDSVLGIPFNDADQFIVSGEGLGGGFRLHHKSIGHFGPRPVKSKVNTYQIGGEIQAGGAWGGGADIGLGQNISRLVDWNRYPAGSSFSKVSDETEDEPVFFRFINDMGGNWGVDLDDKPFQSEIGVGEVVTELEDESQEPLILSNNNYSITTSGAFKYQLNDGERAGRSSYIGFNFNKDVISYDNRASYRAYSKRVDINKLANKSEESLKDNIGELAVFNQGGLRYVYGLPVYSRNEKSLSYGVEGGVVTNNSMIHFDESSTSKKMSNPKIKIGEEKPDAYATSYLLTEITTPDYVDRSLDGPTIDDFGGYTRFNYQKTYGTGNTWYKWRFPYNGLRYQRNSLSDPKDDLASYSGGEKEIYFLQNIETKSHVAIFHTSLRDGDGLGAADETAAWGDAAKSSNKLQKLDKIELFPISAFEKNAEGKLKRKEDGTLEIPDGATPVKTVYFKYATLANELAKGAPNMASGRGKLTLEKVYFEYNGKSETRISPYIFEYNYPDFNEYPLKYRSGGVDDITLGTTAQYTLDQNPDYSEFNSDAWGNYQPNGETRHDKMRGWLDQAEIPNESFDPAAWQLKVIKLPSGGEIHVQYEADDYQYVQDKEAHVMAPLKESVSRERVAIDHESLGIIPGTDDYNDKFFGLVDMLKERYVNQGNKIYFKFLYKLMGSGVPDLNSCNIEYIDGYVNVKSVEVKQNLQDNEYYIYLNFDGDELPLEVCKEFTKTQRLGMLDINGSCDAASVAMNGTDDSPEKVVRQLLTYPSRVLDLAGLQYCQELSPELSYLRVPASFAKRGGGLRVKRLLTFDKGLEGQAVVYGNEYIYKTTDDFGKVISSGVATNEPQTIREENILVDLLKGSRNKGFKRIISGKNKLEQEGPIGESIYPGASVGYSKVIIRNIHSGETNPGFTVNEYLTAKDHPILTDNTNIEDETEFGFGFGGFVNFFLKKQWATQGFVFVLNDMHGKPGRMATYSGDYSDMLTLNESLIISEQDFEYYLPGEKVQVKSSTFGSSEYANLGKEVDITLAQKAFEEQTIDGEVEVDFSVGIMPFIIPLPIPFATSVPKLTLTEGGVATHATTKVIRYPAILKKITSYQDGIKHVTEQVAFDKYTGNVIATRTYDEFKGSYFSESVMASWEYQAMSDMASSEGKLVDAGFTLDGNRLKLSQGEVCDLTQFTRGDLIELGSGTGALFHIVEIDYARESLKVLRSQQNKAPAIHSASNLRIVRTGRKNALSADVGSIVRHDPTEKLYPIFVNEANRYQTGGAGSFVTALNNAMDSRSGTSGSFNLTGEYLNMNMAAYEQGGHSSINWQNVKIKDVEIRYFEEDNHVIVDIMAFKVECSGCQGGWLRVVAQGWT